MEVNVINYFNEINGVIELDPSIFCIDNRPDILKRVFEWQMSKRRLGTHKTKGISDVSGTTAKPYKQKHTGRARQGSLRSPQFKGGAVIFGPQNRSHSYSLNKKVRNLGLKVALSLKKNNNQLLIMDNINGNFNKTKEISKSFKDLGYSSFLIIGNYGEKITCLCRNLYNVKLVAPVGINVVDILSHHCVILAVDAIKYLEGRLL